MIGANQCSSVNVVEDALHERGEQIDYAFRSDDNTTLQGLVAARFGVALMPLLAIQQGDDRVKVIALDPPGPPPPPRRRLAPRPAPLPVVARVRRDRPHGQRRGRAGSRRAVGPSSASGATARMQGPVSARTAIREAERRWPGVRGPVGVAAPGADRLGPEVDAQAAEARVRLLRPRASIGASDRRGAPPGGSR